MRFAVLALLLLLAACSEPAGFKATDISQANLGGYFDLTAHNGKRLTLSELRGKIVMLFFGYANCPDICAPTLAKLAQARAQLGKDAQPVQVVFISLDPGRDTPKQLASFVSRFDPTFIGLTGTPAEIDAVGREYKIAHHPGPSSIDHSGGMFVIDRTGRLRLYLSEGVSVDDIVHDLRLLLKENA